MDAIERGLRFGAAVIVASLAAGPICWFVLVLVSLPFSPEAAGLGLIWFAVLTIPYGAMLAFLPVLIGTATMTALGAWFRWARSPLAWISAGALGSVLFAIIFAGAGSSDLFLLAAMVATGMACAAICRAFTRWSDWDGDAQA